MLGLAYPLKEKLFNQSYFIPMFEIFISKNREELALIFYILTGLIFIIYLLKYQKYLERKKVKVSKKENFIYILQSLLTSMFIGFILLIPMVIISKLTQKLDLSETVGDLLDNFATTLDIFNIFQIYSKDKEGNLTNTSHFYKSYYFIYKLYAILILVLIYQLILAIRRRVKK